MIDRILKEMRMQGVTQSDLAKLIHGEKHKAGSVTINRILGGNLKCSLEMVFKLLSAIGANPNVIIESPKNKNFQAAYDRLNSFAKGKVMIEIERAHKAFRLKNENPKEKITIECYLYMSNYINNHVSLITLQNKAFLTIEKVEKEISYE